MLRRYAAAVLAGTALLAAACTSSAASPTTVPPTSSSAPFTVAPSPPASSMSAVSGSSSQAIPDPPSSTTKVPTSAKATTKVIPTTTPALPTGPWPKNLTAAQIKEAQSAIATYVGYYHLIDKSFAAPGSKNWTADIHQFATGAEAASSLQYITALAKAGQRTSGTTGISPKVTKVQPALVTISDCVDTTHTNFYNKAGVSIKAPNAPGSYYRHPSQIQIGQYVGGKWLVTVTTDDWTKTC